MARRTSIATVSISGALTGKLRAAAAAGFDGVEVFEDDLVSSPASPEEIRNLAGDLGLVIELYQPFRDFEAVPPEPAARNLRRATRKLEVARRLGASMLLVCSNCSVDAIDDDSVAAAQLRDLAESAAGYGVRIAYEALAWGRHVNDYRHAWRIVDAAQHPNLGLCLDSFHILSRGDDPRDIRKIPGERIFFLQLADAPTLGMEVLPWSRHYRCFPGQGDFDLHAFTEHVLATGYDGPFSLEVFSDLLRYADPQRAAVDGRRSLLALGGPIRPAGGGVPAVDHAPALAGWAFTELGVDAGSAGAASALLRSLGFALRGRHRSKPVELWQQGHIRLLLTCRTAGSGVPGRLTLAGIAVETSDPAGAAEWARGLLVPPRPRRHAPGEADFPEFAAPDGTSVFFCSSTPDDQTSWVHDFVAEPSSGRHTGVGLTHLDHLGLPVPFGHLDEAVLFCESVLGLSTQEGPELAAPGGLVRGRTMVSPSGEIRIALTSPIIGGDQSGWAESPHVALGCTDVFATARAMHRLGAPILAISGNYYDDLEARFELDRELLDALQRSSIMYDRDPGGELLHFYTAARPGAVAFEVLQRVGNYRGLGARDAPVRMAAQSALSDPGVPT